MTLDTAATVAALQAAGDNVDALANAIIQASYLDDIPGEDRQKLRGECSPKCLVLGLHANVDAASTHPAHMPHS